jgi:hypothetical protein
MATYSTYYNLYKPAIDQPVWGAEINNNWDIIDGALALAMPKTGGTFTGNVSMGSYKITLPNVTANRVLCSNSSQEVVSSGISDTVLGYLDISSSLTTLLSNKEPTLTKYDLAGTTNQVNLSGSGTGVLLARNLTLSLPQSIGISSVVQFGSLGIGVSPSYTLDVNASTAQFQLKSTTGTNSVLARLNNTGGDLYFGREGSAGAYIITGSTSYQSVISSVGDYDILIGRNSSVVAKVISTGLNLPQLTASTMLQLDSSKNIISSNTLEKNSNASNVFRTTNTTSGTASVTGFNMNTDVGSSYFLSYSTGYTGTINGIAYANLTLLSSNTYNSGLMISQDGAKPIYLATNGVVRQTIDSAGATTFSGTTSVTKDQNAATRFLVQNPNAGATAYSEIYTASDVANFHLYTVSSGNVATYCGLSEASLNELVSTGNGLLINQAGVKSIYLATNSTTRFTLNGSGNIGVGTTDIEAWHTSFKAIEFADTAISSQTDGTLMFHSNYYYDGANKYKATGAAASYYISGGTHVFRVAPGGTADTAITWTTALTIDNSGNSTFSGSASLGACLMLPDGQTAPSATSGKAKIYVDTADGDLKVIFGDGTIKTIVTDT